LSGQATRVLEIGTGSATRQAGLAEIVESVYSIEIVPALAADAAARLARMHYDNVHVRWVTGTAAGRKPRPSTPSW
jgi:protein-L-isoaspartate(D-aspartate) O-methyltransferase